MRSTARLLLKQKTGIGQMFVAYLPGVIGDKLRYFYWRGKLRHLGRKVKIDVGVYFQNPEHISIDDNCWIDRGVIILAGQDNSSRERTYIANPDFPIEKGMAHIGKNVHIGLGSIISAIGGVFISDNCTLSAGARIYSFTHHYRSEKEPWNRAICFGSLVPHHMQYMIEGPIYLGENVGVALNAVILPGVSIGKDSFVMINSVVKDTFEENSLIAGNPARRITDRYVDKGKTEDE